MRGISARYLSVARMVSPNSNETQISRLGPPVQLFTVASHLKSPLPQAAIKDKEKRRGKFLKALRPLLFLFRLAGFLPIVAEPNGGFTSCFKNFTLRSVLLTSYAICIYTFFLVHSVLMYKTATSLTTQDKSSIPIEQYVIKYSLMLEAFSLVLVPLTFWCKTVDFCRYLDQWRHLEGHYLNVTGQKLVALRTGRVVTVIVFMATVFLSMRQQYMLYSMHIYSIVHNICCKSLWYLLCSALHNSAAQLLSHYKMAVASCNMTAIRDFRGLWLELASLVQAMGHVFTANFIILFVNAIANVSSLLYGFLTHQEVGYKWLVFGLGILIVTCLLVNVAHQASQQAGYILLRELQNLEFQQRDERIKTEINTFIQTVAVDPPSICLGDFVTLNRKLLSSLLGTLVTNLIVLLQFQGARIKYGTDIDIRDLQSLD